MTGIELFFFNLNTIHDMFNVLIRSNKQCDENLHHIFKYFLRELEKQIKLIYFVLYPIFSFVQNFS